MYRRGAILFDMTDIPKNSTVTSAKLTLVSTYMGLDEFLGNDTMCVSRFVTEWDVKTATWKTRNKTTPWDTDSGGGDIAPNGLWLPIKLEKSSVVMDVTPVAQFFVSNPEKNFGFSLYPSKDAILTTALGSSCTPEYDFNSSEARTVSSRPKLEITYTEGATATVSEKNSAEGISVHISRGKILLNGSVEKNIKGTLYQTNGRVVQNVSFEKSGGVLQASSAMTHGVYILKLFTPEKMLYECTLVR